MDKYNEENTQQLKRTLFLYLASALLILLAAISLIMYLILFSRLKDAEDHQLYHAAEMQSIAVNQWSRRAKDLALQITSRTRIRQELEKYNRGEIPLSELTAFTKPKLDDAMNLAEEIIGIARLDAENKIVSLSGDAVSFEEKEAAGFASDSIQLSNPVKINGKEVILVSAPILNSRKDKEGTDLVFIDTYLLRQIISSVPSGGPIDIYLAMFSGTDPVIMGKDNPLPEAAAIKNKYSAFLSKAAEGDQGIVNTGNEIIVFSPVSECCWGIAAVSNRKELYAALNFKLILTGILLAVLYISTLFGFSILVKPLAGRILLYSSELEEEVREKTHYLEDEIEVRKKSEREKEIIILDLENALGKIKKLQGLLPICSVCKKIRDDKGYWNSLETYISENSDADFSHGLCPECFEKAKAEMKHE